MCDEFKNVLYDMILQKGDHIVFLCDHLNFGQKSKSTYDYLHVLRFKTKASYQFTLSA
jgi:hypothetical protein